MCFPLSDQDISEEEMGVEDADITSSEDDDDDMEHQAHIDRLQAESERLRALLRDQDIGEEEMGVANEDITDAEEDDDDDMELQAQIDRIQAESDGLRAEYNEFKENWFLIVALLQYTVFHDLDTEKGLLHVNMVLAILGEEKVLEANWGLLISEQKKEVFEILLKLDYEKEIVEGEKSEERIKAIADISAVICNNNKGSLEVESEESQHDVEINMLESEAIKDDSKVEQNNFATEDAKSAIEQGAEKGLISVDKALDLGGQERVLEKKLEKSCSSQENEDENLGEGVIGKSCGDNLFAAE